MMLPPSRAARALVGSVAALALLGSTTTGATRGAMAHRAGPAGEPAETVATALAVDQRTGTVFVVSGAFGRQTGGAAASGTLSVRETRHGRMRRLRTVAVGYGPSTVVLDERAGRVLVLNLGGGNKYAGFTGGSVSVLDLQALESTGLPHRVVARSTSLGRQLPRAIAIDRTSGYAVVATWTLPASGIFTRMPTGRVIVLDTRTGSPLHTVNVRAAPEAVATDEVSGRTFVLLGGEAAGGRVSVLDTRTGTVVQTFNTGPGSGPLAVDGRAGRLFVGTPSAVQVRMARGGALERIVTVGQMPVALAIDEHRGRVFVQSAGGFASPSAASGGVSMLDARSGALLGVARIGAATPFMQMLIGGTPQTLAVDETGGRVLAATSTAMGQNGVAKPQGLVSVLAAQGWALRVVHTTTLNALPVALATDTLTGHAFVSTTMMTGSGPSRPGVSMLDLRTGIILGAVSL